MLMPQHKRLARTDIAEDDLDLRGWRRSVMVLLGGATRGILRCWFIFVPVLLGGERKCAKEKKMLSRNASVLKSGARVHMHL